MKKTTKKLVLAKETVRNLQGLENVKGGTYVTYSCGAVGTCGGSAHPYVCENLDTSASADC